MAAALDEAVGEVATYSLSLSVS
eukprot:COSAG05_NODE_4163_length_1646_cov_17.789270_3_plen_22_part_01